MDRRRIFVETIRTFLVDIRHDPRVANAYLRVAAIWLAHKLGVEAGLIGTAIGFFLGVVGLSLGAIPWAPSLAEPDTFLATSITILATVLAIVVSVALLGVQLIMGSFAPSVAKEIGKVTR